MIGSWHDERRTAMARLLAALSLACGVLLSHHELPAADTNRLAWAPSRDEAIVIDPAGSTTPVDTPLSKALLAQRPRSLSRPVPMRTRTYIAQAPIAGEQLPSVTGTPMDSEGLLAPTETYYDETQIVSGNPACDPRCSAHNCTGQWRGWTVCFCVPQPPKDGFEVFGGVQGITGPANRGGSGSFGFHEGFNWGVPLGGFMAGQFGANFTQSNLDGSYLTNASRDQTFLTGGLYRRVDWGFQGGLVVDYLHDDWDYTADLLQLRGELSWLWCDCNEVGFWFTAGVNDANNLVMRLPTFSGPGGNITVATGTATLAVNDIYAFFFRRQFASGGQGRLFGGFTGHGQGLVGGDAQLPINPNWSLRSSFIYVAPDDSNTATDPAFTRESWNVSISLVWNPCPRSIGVPNYCRPLFNVADNGTFITRLLRR